jgi:hypothetical protein
LAPGLFLWWTVREVLPHNWGTNQKFYTYGGNMENLEIIMDTYYSALYWRAFFYGMLIPSLVYLVFNYFTHRMIRRHFQRFEAQIRDAYNELIIKDLESQAEFLKGMTDTMKKENDECEEECC